MEQRIWIQRMRSWPKQKAQFVRPPMRKATGEFIGATAQPLVHCCQPPSREFFRLDALCRTSAGENRRYCLCEDFQIQP
jgi:hypothetical protein